MPKGRPNRPLEPQEHRPSPPDPPQAGILAVGGISERVVARNGQPVIRPIMTVTLSSDHRVVDGAGAAEFLRDLADAIREPAKWLG